MVDEKTAKTLTSERYFKPTVYVLLVFSAIFAVSFSWLYKENDKLHEEQAKFTDKRVEFERYIRNEEGKLAAKKNELERKEDILAKKEQDNAARDAELNGKMNSYEAGLTSIKEREVAVSKLAKIKEAEGRIEKLISEYSDLGVNLSAQVVCGDQEAIEKKNRAENKLTEIRSLIRANGLSERYAYFLRSSSPLMINFGCLPRVKIG